MKIGKRIKKWLAWFAAAQQLQAYDEDIAAMVHNIKIAFFISLLVAVVWAVFGFLSIVHLFKIMTMDLNAWAASIIFADLFVSVLLCLFLKKAQIHYESAGGSYFYENARNMVAWVDLGFSLESFPKNDAERSAYSQFAHGKLREYSDDMKKAINQVEKDRDAWNAAWKLAVQALTDFRNNTHIMDPKEISDFRKKDAELRKVTLTLSADPAVFNGRLDQARSKLFNAVDLFKDMGLIDPDLDPKQFLAQGEDTAEPEKKD